MQVSDRLDLVCYVMGGLLLYKVRVLWLFTCYVKYSMRIAVWLLAVSLLSMFFVRFLEVVNGAFVRCW